MQEPPMEIKLGIIVTISIVCAIIFRKIMKKILIIEDNDCLSEVLKDAFTEIGYDVSVALIGTDAVHIIETVRLDLIILDMVLPGINGLEILGLVKQKYSKIPVLIYTAFEDYEKKYQTMFKEDRFCAFLLKPVYIEKLISESERLIDTCNKSLLQDFI